MTKPLAISQRQAQTLFRAAEAERGIVEFTLGDTVFRLIPRCHVASGAAAIDDGQTKDSLRTLDDYKSWRDRNRVDRD